MRYRATHLPVTARPLAMVLLTAAVAASAGEGKWTPQQVLELGPQWVKTQGFQLPLEKLWSEKKAGGLLGNAVALPGCTGAFVSAQGLLITNHHCVVSILQQHSTAENNLYKTGYVARSRGVIVDVTALDVLDSFAAQHRLAEVGKRPCRTRRDCNRQAFSARCVGFRGVIHQVPALARVVDHVRSPECLLARGPMRLRRQRIPEMLPVH